MVRGFSLIELLITIIVIIILSLAAVPSFGYLNEKSKMQRLAEELSGFLLQARSEAVMQNQSLYLSFLPTGSSSTLPILDGSWGVALSASGSVPSSYATAQVNAVMYLDGQPFKNVTVYSDNRWQPLQLDGINGHPAELSDNAAITFSINANKRLQVRTEKITGRIKVCGLDGDNYGYPQC